MSKRQHPVQMKALQQPKATSQRKGTKNAKKRKGLQQHTMSIAFPLRFFAFFVPLR
jgi:hypothetical protein